MLPAFREYERCSTTVIDAYLSPLLGRYLAGLAEACRERGLPEPQVMRSSGRHGATPTRPRGPGAWSVLSGPAGGAVGAGVARAERAAAGDAIGIDMGGTSCDVCVVDGGEVRRTDSREIGGPPDPAADGRRPHGRRRRRLDRLARRGRRPAGRARARRAPSPARPATAAAAPSRPSPTPTCCSATWLPDSDLAGGVALDAEAARGARRRARRASSASSEIETAEGIVRVANQEMVRALRVVTVERGVDPRGYALLPFGGAGPMHAAALAEELEISRIVCPRASGVLSALGLIAAGRRRDTARTVLLSGDGDHRRAASPRR